MAQNPAAGAPPGQFSAGELNRIVLEYLNKKGYTRTEAMLRVEAEGGRASEGQDAYERAYKALRDFADESLDLYKPELRRILYPVFVHSYLNLIQKGYVEAAKAFFDKFSNEHTIQHQSDLTRLRAVVLPTHLDTDPLAKLYRSNKYRLRMSETTYHLLTNYLTENEASNGNVSMGLINAHVAIDRVAGRPGTGSEEGEEGIIGLGGGAIDDFNAQAIKLGPFPMDPELVKDVESELRMTEADLLPEFMRVKQEGGEDSPMRENMPLPPHKGADVRAEVENLREIRKRVRLGPQAAKPSVCMYTFHNTYDGLNCVDFSEDASLVAGGFGESYVRIWSLKGEKLVGAQAKYGGQHPEDGLSTRRMIGHSGPVYGVSFSPDSKYLLSCSEDKSVRLWSMDTYSSIVAYKGHTHPVWDVKFSPFGHYFATASGDQTAKLWSTEHVYPLRIFAGHLSDVDTVSFHPNSAYVVTGSSDKTCRLWDVQRGSAVRVFTGHTGGVLATKISPDGKWLASAGEDGTIKIWDIGSGKKLKDMRGHQRGYIYSLDWSRDGAVIVSGGSDNTVRVWDVKKNTPAEKEEGAVNGTPIGGPDMAMNMNGTGGTVGGAGGKDGKMLETSDHMAAFGTKRTPVYKVHFTKRNLVLAAGAIAN
ncbi:Transcription initiation factor TFIID subunit 5 [Saitoella coloradoensis]